MTVTVRVPATSANLGPGFDCLGLALELAAEVTISAAPQGATPDHPLNTMVAAAYRAGCRAAGEAEPVELCVAWKSDGLPVARGLGASAAARAAGLVAANASLEGALGDDELFAAGAELEGHPDNIAPALFGGLQVCVRDRDGWLRSASPIADGLRVVLLVPDFEMPTQESRRRLPKQLSRVDAVSNASRAALLVAALAQGHWDLLDAATQDRLHQPARGEIFTALEDVFEAAKEGGAHAAYLSGGGSTVAALATGHEERIARLMLQAAIARGYSGKTIITKPSAQGAMVAA
jgi:homoserine kinase